MTKKLSLLHFYLECIAYYAYYWQELVLFLQKKEDMREIHNVFYVFCWQMLKYYLSLYQHMSIQRWCACNGMGIQGVESGKFNLEIMNTSSQSKFAPYIGREFLFLLFLNFGFTRALLLEKLKVDFAPILLVKIVRENGSII